MMRLHDVMVSISDSDSGDLGSIPSEAFAFCVLRFFFLVFSIQFFLKRKFIKGFNVRSLAGFMM